MGEINAFTGLMGGINSWNDTSDERNKENGLWDTMYSNMNTYSPHGYESVSPSQFQNISTDPSTRAAQMKALSGFGDVASHQGMDEQSRAAEFEAMRGANANEQSQRNALEQNLSARGMGGSGANIAGLMAAQQGGANRAASAGMESAANARSRQLAALGQMGSLGGSIRGEDWKQASDRASGMDQMSRFNADQRAKQYEDFLRTKGMALDALKGYTGQMDTDIARKNAFDTGVWGDVGQFASGAVGGGMGGMGSMGGMGGSSGKIDWQGGGMNWGGGGYV